MSIATAAGKPIAIDKATQSKTRTSTARVRVILDLLDKHPNSVTLQYVDEKSGKITETTQEMVYDNLPLYYSCCKRQGHGENSCCFILSRTQDNIRNGASEDCDDRNTAAPVELVEKPTGCKATVVIVEGQVDDVDGAAATGVKAGIKDDRNSQRIAAAQPNVGHVLGRYQIGGMKTSLGEGSLRECGEKILVSHQAGVEHTVGNKEDQELGLQAEISNSNYATAGQVGGSTETMLKRVGTSRNPTVDGWTVVTSSPAKKSMSLTLKNTPSYVKK